MQDSNIKLPYMKLPNVVMFSSGMDTDWEDPEVLWKEELQSYRMHLVDCLSYNRICAALLSYQVIDSEDHEELSNQIHFRTEKMRINRLIDILMKKEDSSYKKFLDVLGLYYAQVYTDITHKSPPHKGPDLVEVTSNLAHEDLVQLLMQALERMKQENQEWSKRYKRCNKAQEDREQECERLKRKIDDLTQRVERYDGVDNEIASLRQEVDRLKNENYNVCMKMIDTNEENTKLRDANIKLRNDNDKVKVDLQKLESCVAVERNQSVRLRNRLQHSPSGRDIMEMKKEIDALKLKLAQANSRSYSEEDIDMRIQILKQDKEEAIEMYAGAVETLNKLREDCSNAEMAREKYLDEKEQLNLTCSVLESDINMYKMRRDIAWQQLQEVEKEREMVMKERNESQLFAKACMQEKTHYRQQIRQLEEKYDQQTQKLLEMERKLLSIGRSRHPSSDGINWTPYSSSQPTSISTSTASSTQTADRNQSNTSSDCDFRGRTYNTKRFKQFRSKNCCNEVVDNSKKKIFPEIELAANYGPHDSSLSINDMQRSSPENVMQTAEDTLTTKEIKRANAHRRKTRPSINSSSSKQLSCESITSSSNSNEDANATAMSASETVSAISVALMDCTTSNGLYD